MELGTRNLQLQLKAHLDALRSAGVEFVPVGEPLTFAQSSPARRESEGEGQPSLTLRAGDIALDSPDARRHELIVLAKEIEPCNRCPELFSTRTQTVFGVGPIDPEICFVGEAPGADEDAQGEPFVGRAGQLLNKIIAACGFKREDVYIANVVKHRPPGNRVPLPAEVKACLPYLVRQVEIIRPAVILALGLSAAQALLETTEALGKLRGREHLYHGIPVIVTYHPAALLRNPAWKRPTWEDVQLARRILDRTAAA